MQRRFSIIIGGFLVIVMAATAILPAISPPETQVPTEEPTPNPTVEPFPSPIASESLDYSMRYLHPGALYTIPIPQPIVWQQVIPSNESGLARVTLRSELQVIETYIQEAPGISAEDLPNEFTDATLEQTWRNYQDRERRGPGEMRGERFYVDYDMTLNRRQFHGRHVAWTDGERIYVVRVVGPTNAVEQTIQLAEEMAAQLETIPQFVDAEVNWSAHYDADIGYVARFPSSWELQDMAPGLPASVVDADGAATLRLEALEAALVDMNDARRLLKISRSDATLLADAELSEGMALSYAYETPFGEERSGIWWLLPQKEGGTLRAELTFPASKVNLLEYQEAGTASAADEEPELLDTQYVEYWEILRSLTPVTWDYVTQDELSDDEAGNIVLPVNNE